MTHNCLPNQDDAARKTLSGARLPRENLIELAKNLVGPMTDGSANYTRVATGVMALREHGIMAEMLEREVVFDPEKHTRPHFLYGLRLARVKGAVFCGVEIDTWKGATDAARGQLSQPGDYLDMARTRKVDVDSFIRINMDLGIVNDWLTKARAAVGDCLLQRDTHKAADGSRRAPRF